MAKLIALLATLLVVAHATAAFRTTITTVETVESDNPSQECQHELGQINLNSCMQYLMEQQQQGGGRRQMDTGGRRGSHYLDTCCEQLRRFDDERCMCEGLEMEMQKQMRTRPEMMRTAENLPQMCGATSACQFRPRFF